MFIGKLKSNLYVFYSRGMHGYSQLQQRFVVLVFLGIIVHGVSRSLKRSFYVTVDWSLNFVMIILTLWENT